MSIISNEHQHGSPFDVEEGDAPPHVVQTPSPSAPSHPLQDAIVGDGTVSIPSDDAPTDVADRLHILASNDYYISIEPGTNPSPLGPSFRACTSGARNSFVTAVFAALYKRARGDVRGAIECLRVAISEAEGATR